METKSTQNNTLLEALKVTGVVYLFLFLVSFADAQTNVKVNNFNANTTIETVNLQDAIDKGRNTVSLDTGNRNFLSNPYLMFKTPSAAWSFRNLSGDLACTLSSQIPQNTGVWGRMAITATCSGSGTGEVIQTKAASAQNVEFYGSAHVFQSGAANFEEIGLNLYRGTELYSKKLVTLPVDYFSEAIQLEGTIKTSASVTAMTYAVYVKKSNASTNVSFQIYKPFLGVINAPSWTMNTVKNTTNFKSYGPIQITGTTTNPTKGTRTIDDISFGQDGDFWQGRIQYNQTAIGNSGSGSYLITLPDGVEIDDSWVQAGNPANSKSIGQVEMISSHNPPVVLKGFAYPVSSKTISFSISSANGAEIPWGSAAQGLGVATINFSANLKFKGKGLRSTVDIASQAMNYMDSKNHFLMSVTVAGNGTIIKQVPTKWISSCTNVTTPVCAFSSGVFTVEPSCWVTTKGNAFIGPTVNNLSTVYGRIINNSAGDIAGERTYYCTKNYPDSLESFREMMAGAIKESNIYYDRDEFHTDERDTGRKYNSKIIYKKCMSGTSVDNRQIQTGVEDLVSFNGYVFWKATSTKIPIPIYSGAGGELSVQVNGTGVLFERATNSGVTTPVKYCVEYTKL